jgi:hypothetical protein
MGAGETVKETFAESWKLGAMGTCAQVSQAAGAASRSPFRRGYIRREFPVRDITKMNKNVEE